MAERFACRAVGQHRSTQRLSRRAPAEEERLLCQELREISTTWPRYGYRMAWRKLRQRGRSVNRKRVQRLWREEGLRVGQRAPKRRRTGDSAYPAKRLRAEWPNHVWALDFMFDATSDRRPFKSLSMCDEFTRECIGDEIARSIRATDVERLLDTAAAERGLPVYVRMDNGPEFVANAIRSWCERNGAATSYIDPGSPWQNPYVESFNSRARDEVFAREVFDTIIEAKVIYRQWRHEYNHERPHSALRDMTPAQFRTAWLQQAEVLATAAATPPLQSGYYPQVTESTRALIPTGPSSGVPPTPPNGTHASTPQPAMRAPSRSNTATPALPPQAPTDLSSRTALLAYVTHPQARSHLSQRPACRGPRRTTAVRLPWSSPHQL